MLDIRKARERVGISQSLLAQKIGVTQSAVSQWEQGFSVPGCDKLPQLAHILGCTIDDLFPKNTRKELKG
jgi:transcriptional regulator with XRE-family HTH domain